MKLTLLALVLLTTPVAIAQQIPCVNYDDHQGTDSPDDRMKGCRSFNELQAAGGIKIEKYPGIKSYACFAKTVPEEASDIFIFIELAGVVKMDNDKEHNGFAKMSTFLQGVKLNDGFADLTWTQYPKEKPLLWSEGSWMGRGESQMMKFGPSGKLENLPGTDAEWKSIGHPRLKVSIESDTVEFNLELFNGKDTVETLTFNRRTGRGRLEMGSDLRSIRCVSVWEQN